MLEFLRAYRGLTPGLSPMMGNPKIDRVRWWRDMIVYVEPLQIRVLKTSDTMHESNCVNKSPLSSFTEAGGREGEGL